MKTDNRLANCMFILHVCVFIFLCVITYALSLQACSSHNSAGHLPPGPGLRVVLRRDRSRLTLQPKAVGVMDGGKPKTDIC